MNRNLLLCAIALIPACAIAQKLTVHGTVKDKTTGEALIGAAILNMPTDEGTTSNNYGFYSLTIRKDSVQLRISFVGYSPTTIKLFLSKDTTINIGLESSNILQEVVVTGNADDEIQNTTRMGTIDVPVETIKAVPAILGEVDVLKVLQLLPGVQGGTEGSSGLYVRGGGPDQNLILLDGVPVYNASHLFGFFSVFNADAINHVELIKGGFPARYGGRLSSVIDINMKEGNNEKIKGEGSIGLIATRLTVEGPIKKNKSTFIISGRRTYLDILARPLIRKETNGDGMFGYYFYDLNAKVNYTLDQKNRIYLSMYSGDDRAMGEGEEKYSEGNEVWKSQSEAALYWGNVTTALRWNSILTKKLFSNVTATLSRYRFGIGAKAKETYINPDTTTVQYYGNQYNSGIRDLALKFDFDFLPTPRHFIKFGAHATRHLFTPGVLSYRETEIPDTTVGAKKIFADEFAVYFEDDILISNKLKLNVGLRSSAFHVDDVLYHSVQPRVALRYLVSANLSMKASYAQMTQYIHLLSNLGIGLPTDLWVPSTKIVVPEQSYLLSAGGAYNLKKEFEFSIETYYKKMDGLIEYQEGASYLNIESDWQTKVESGSGTSYGAEFFVQKKQGKWNGWLGYTLSWADRKFPFLNGGKTYPYRYDRRHDVELVLNYKFKPNKEFSFTWVYATGSAVTLPRLKYPQYEQQPHYGFYGNTIKYYGGINNFRMNAYHRLDIGYTTTKKTKWGERSWNIGLYNAYSRPNPFFIDIGYDKNHNRKFIQYSLFPIIPSIAYRFKF
jgi:hypothetical protein